MRAVFLDRDGVINRNRDDYVKSVDELEILNVGESIKKLQSRNFLVIVISNQSAINRGLTSHSKVNQIHSSIQNYLKKFDTKIDAFYYCPHRPDENCDCRKPKPGLLLKAAQDFEIILESSFMIGDRESDMLAATKAGCKFYKIQENGSIDPLIKEILSS